MQFFIVAVLSLGIAYQVYSSETDTEEKTIKAKMRENGLFGDLWVQPGFDINTDSFENNKYIVTDVTSRVECAMMCLQTEDCVDFIVQMLCKPEPWSCSLILKANYRHDKNASTIAKHFTKHYKQQAEVQGVFYRHDMETYTAVVGTVLVTYKTLDNLIGKKPEHLTTISSLFPTFNKAVEDVLVRQVVDAQDTYLLFHLISGNTSYTYRLDSKAGPAVQVSVQGVDFISAYGWVDAAIELGQCHKTCLNGNSQASTTYFLIAGKYIYEAQGDTWLESADGEFYDKDGSSFPVGLNEMTAASKFALERENLFLVFEGLKARIYHISSAVFTNPPQMNLCP